MQLEQTLNKVEQFYSSKRQLSISKNTLVPKDKDKDKHLNNFRKRQQDASRRESTAVKKMQELMRQFGTIIRQVSRDHCNFISKCLFSIHPEFIKISKSLVFAL